jgi:hypothetical protein
MELLREHLLPDLRSNGREYVKKASQIMALLVLFEVVVNYLIINYVPCALPKTKKQTNKTKQTKTTSCCECWSGAVFPKWFTCVGFFGFFFGFLLVFQTQK